MRKILIVLLSCALLFIACQSRERKIEGLVKNELTKMFSDYENYQPMETQIKEARFTLYNDTFFGRMGSVLANSMGLWMTYKNKIDETKRQMNIWGTPTSYSSSYSDEQYYKYQKELEAEYKVYSLAYQMCMYNATHLKDTIGKCDTTKIIGWEVFHRFKVETKGGTSTSANVRLILDKDFNKILLWEDLDDSESKATRVAIESIKCGFWE